jgi:hypothetical protein
MDGNIVKTDKAMTNKALTQFFTERPAITKAGFAREIGVSMTMLGYYIKGDPISDKVADRMREIMRKYGWESP